MHSYYNKVGFFQGLCIVDQWRNLAAKAKWNIKEEDAVQMVINN